ncbi:MAG: peptidoglycan DD-metalloendopeptidase family protein [Myxococcota bacterium]
MWSLLFTALFTQASADPGFGGESAESVFGGDQAELSVADREKAAMRQRMAEDRVRSQFLKKEETSILGAISELDGSLEAQKKKGLEVFARRQKLALELAKVEKDLAESTAKLDVLKAEIGHRAAAMHRLKRTSFADLLARAKAGPELRRLRDRLGVVLAFDAKLVASTRDLSKESRRLFAELGQEKVVLETTNAELEAEKERLLQLREDRAALLKAIKNEREVIERVASEVAQSAKKLDQELNVIHGQRPAPAPAPGGFEAQRGRLPWPVVAKIEVPFGKRVDPDTGVIVVHKGLDLRAPLADPIRAVFRGKVAFRSTLEGFGRVIILDHEQGWYTIYAHLESFGVPEGAEINEGQVLGYVGDSGSLKGPYLYFEIRQGRNAVDPGQWLAR